MIVDLKSRNALLQEQLDTLMLSTDDADLYDLDINGELSLVMLFTCNHLSVYRYPVCLNKIFNQDICYFLML